MEYRPEYPLSIVNALSSEKFVTDFLVTLIEEAHKYSAENMGGDFIPPIAFNVPGRAYNVDYNFMIYALSYHLDEVMIQHDFGLNGRGNGNAEKLGLLLVGGVFEDYYGMVRINNNRIETMRYRNAKVIELQRRFYNVLGLKCGMNVRRFSAVPFREISLVKLLDKDMMRMLDEVSRVNTIEQVFFADSKYQEYLRANEIDTVDPVYELPYGS